MSTSVTNGIPTACEAVGLSHVNSTSVRRIPAVIAATAITCSPKRRASRGTLFTLVSIGSVKRIDDAIAVDRRIGQSRPAAIRTNDAPCTAVRHKRHLLSVPPPAIDLAGYRHPDLAAVTKSLKVAK